MPPPRDTIIELERKFWHSLASHDTETAVRLLTEPALLVSARGTMQVDHEAYRKMADKGPMTLSEFQLSEMRVVFPNDSTAVVTYHARQKVAARGSSDGAVQEMNDSSVWIKDRGNWRCVMHTETPSGPEHFSH
jgi:ketosteroid isomerase-like protein